MATIEIDGSRGEGGGQVLRSALTLSVVTGKAVHVENIRAGRHRPGLMAQHLKAVEAAAAISQAHVEGARLGSQTLAFSPRDVSPGNFHFDIGTAGSTSLVLQTIVPALSLASAPSSVTVTGGTHVPWSPCFEYLQWHWLPYMRDIGFAIELAMDLAGFYPRGGGRVRATVNPGAPRQPLNLTERGALRGIRGVSGVADLDLSVAQRQGRRARERLAGCGTTVEIELVRLPARFKGTVLLLLAEFEHSRCCYFAIGERGKPAEHVADEAVDALGEFLASDGAVDQYLADQLVLPLALVPGPSKLRTSKVTQHLLTNAEIVSYFLPVGISIDGTIGSPGQIRIGGPASASTPQP